MYVFADICTTFQAVNGSNCPDSRCRAGVAHCGSKNCHGGVIDNGFCFADRSEIAVMTDRPVAYAFGSGDEYNAPLHAFAKMASQAGTGAIKAAATVDAMNLLNKNLRTKAGMDAETRKDVLLTIREMVTVSFGHTVSLDTTAATLWELKLALSSEDYYRLLVENISTSDRFAKTRSNDEDFGQFASMWEIARATGEPVVIVTTDAGFISTGAVLAKYARGVYVVSPQTYLDEHKLARAIDAIDQVAAQTAVLVAA